MHDDLRIDFPFFDKYFRQVFFRQKRAEKKCIHPTLSYQSVWSPVNHKTRN